MARAGSGNLNSHELERIGIGRADRVLTKREQVQQVRPCARWRPTALIQISSPRGERTDAARALRSAAPRQQTANSCAVGLGAPVAPQGPRMGRDSIYALGRDSIYALGRFRTLSQSTMCHDVCAQLLTTSVFVNCPSTSTSLAVESR